MSIGYSHCKICVVKYIFMNKTSSVNNTILLQHWFSNYVCYNKNTRHSSTCSGHSIHKNILNNSKNEKMSLEKNKNTATAPRYFILDQT